MTNKKMKQNIADAKPDFNECALTAVIFDGQFTPLRLWVEDGQIAFDLSNRFKKNAIFIDSDVHLINQIISCARTLPDIFQKRIPLDFKQKIVALYQKKTYEMLGFMLKSSQAIIGRRAIDRALIGATEKVPLAILQTPEGSDAICKSFKFRQQNLKIIKNFSQELLQKISGREKISFYCILNTDMGQVFVNDYKKYLQFMNEFGS